MATFLETKLKKYSFQLILQFGYQLANKKFFMTSHKESIYHTFMHETITYSFTMFVVIYSMQAMKLHILYDRKMDMCTLHLQYPCLQYHKENEYNTIVSIYYRFQMNLTVPVFSLMKTILKT